MVTVSLICHALLYALSFIIMTIIITSSIDGTFVQADNFCLIEEIKQLEVRHVEQMVCESLECSDNVRATPLAQLLHRKTLGNPFFVQQLLISFHQEGLIKFDFDQVCVRSLRLRQRLSCSVLASSTYLLHFLKKWKLAHQFLLFCIYLWFDSACGDGIWVS